MNTELKKRLREDIGPEDFGVPAEFAQMAKNYAQWVEFAGIAWAREAEKLRKGRNWWMGMFFVLSVPTVALMALVIGAP